MSEKNKSVLPFRKADRFDVYVGEVNSDGRVEERVLIGCAFLKPNSKTFRLKVWLFPEVQYFITPDKEDQTEYSVLCLDEYRMSNGEVRTNWNRVGEGILVGNYIKLKLHLFPEFILVSLFPETQKAEAQSKEVA